MRDEKQAEKNNIFHYTILTGTLCFASNQILEITIIAAMRNKNQIRTL
jgi:hypothetical protein